MIWSQKISNWKFIKAFREVMRYNAQLQTFIEYDQDQTLKLDKQHFANFASKYADLCRDAFERPPKKKKYRYWMMSISNWICCTVTGSNVGYIITPATDWLVNS